MFDQHRLRRAGRARRVDRVGERTGAEPARCGGPRGGGGADDRRDRHLDDRHPEPGEARRTGRIGDDRHGLRVAHDVAQVRVGEGGIQADVRSTGLQHPELGGLQPRRRAGQQHDAQTFARHQRLQSRLHRRCHRCQLAEADDGAVRAVTPRRHIDRRAVTVARNRGREQLGQQHAADPFTARRPSARGADARRLRWSWLSARPVTGGDNHE